MKNIYKFVVENINSGKIDKQTAIQMITMLKEEEVKSSGDIAVIGMSAALPLADTVDEYWEQIANGIESIRQFPASRRKDIDAYLKGQAPNSPLEYAEGAYLEHVDQFDFGFFRISPKEASMMDPAQRLFLETVWKTIEDAGYGGKKLAGTNTGVYVGFANNIKESYGKLIYDSQEIDSSSIVGNLTAIIPSRISFYLDLKGPTMVVDTACSSSLVSISLACQAIRNGQCEMAIAGGIRINTVPQKQEGVELGIESIDGKTRAFDDISDGAGVGEGVGAVLLKPLQAALRDGDHIQAVIKGVAINQDGSSIGITAPNPAAQTEVIVKSWEDAQIDPETISYIETHGTGTNLGDPIEVKGIQDAFFRYTDKTQFCALSSVKTNIGHLFEAAGIANFIAAVKALQNKKIPPSLNFNKPNRTIDFAQSPVYVNTKLRDWHTNGHPRRCGVSSFGISGTNCHIVLEEAPEQTAVEAVTSPDEAKAYRVLTLSAKTQNALQELVNAYQQLLSLPDDASYDFDSICVTANTGRGHYEHRLAILASDVQELCAQLDNVDLSAETTGKRYGFHKIIPKGREPQEPGELTEADLRVLNDKARGFLQDWSTENFKNLGAVEQLVQLYLEGAQIDWERVYAGQNVQKVSLPVYPFERHRCWLQLPDLEDEQELAEQVDLYYTMNWTPSEWKASPQEGQRAGTVLIFKDRAGLGDEIIERYEAEQRPYVVVEQGEKFVRLEDNRFQVGEQEEDYDRVLQAIEAEQVTQIIHLFAHGEAGEIQDLPALQASQVRGLYSLFSLTRSLIRNDVGQELDICIIADHVHEVTAQETVLKPENASLFGIGKVINLEYPNLHCRCFDLDEQVDLNALMRELNSTPTLYQVAYRQGERYVEQFTEVPLDSYQDGTLELRTDGVYVITGGAGGIGLEIAKYFAQRQTVQLAFVQRTPLPDRALWSELLAADADKKLCHKIRYIQEIEALGAKVEVCQADVGSLDEMQQVLDSLRTRYGTIKGVVHAAGIPGDGFIIRKQKDVFDEVVRPKVQGIWILDHLTQQDALDFFVIFSSGISILGEAGQGDYVAANAYLDAYAAYRNKQGRRTTTIDWVSWKSAGMSVEFGFNVDLIFKSIPTDQAIAGFAAVMDKRIPRVLIGELNVNSPYMAVLETLSFSISPKIQKILDQNKATAASKQVARDPKRASGKGSIRLVGKDGADYTEVEQKVAQIYRDILGFDEINIHDSFFELGGDSLTLNKMHALLEQEYPGKVKVSDLFAHTSISKLAQHIGGAEANRKQSVRQTSAKDQADDDIAVIGLAVDMPMAKNAQEYWQNIVNGVECIQAFPEQRAQDMTDFLVYAEGEEPEKIKYLDGSYLDDIDKFDYRFFKLTPNEAKLTDPHQRQFMKTVWHAIEDAGYGGGRLQGSKTGIYLGFAGSLKDSYQRLIGEVDPELLPISAVGNITAMIPSRISYFLDLKGPAMVIDTACSSTLVSLHTACKGLQNGDCEMAIVAGVRISLMPLDREYMKIGIESSTGKTMTFDDNASGSGLGEGASAVLLKPLKQALQDNDQIYAVIKGSAINQDGTSMGITAPNPASQEEVILKAWDEANIDPETLSFIEAHGTATPLGDPIEIDALHNAFRKHSDKSQFCAIGAVKTNMGHLYEAAGLASFVKSVLALKHKVIPPTINFERPNAKINLIDSPIYVNTQARKWSQQDGPMRAGVSSFGFSGTNCHVVLEEGPAIARTLASTTATQVLTLSAKSEASLAKLVESYQVFAQNNPALLVEDLCFTANTGRDHYTHRMALIIQPHESWAEKLSAWPAGGEADGLFQGVHRMVTERKESREEQTLTERERIELSRLAQEKLALYVEGDRQDVALLHLVCCLYVQGATVEWELLYTEGAARVSLPLYPYEEHRCWIDIPEGRKHVNQTQQPDQFFTIAWKPEHLAADSIRTSDGGVLIFKDQTGIGAKLAAHYREQGRPVVEVELGDVYRKTDDSLHVVTGAEDEYQRLIRELAPFAYDKIVHLFAVGQTEGITNLTELEANQQKGLFSLFHLTRALAAEGVEREIDLVLVADYVAEVTGGEEKINPENATMFGMGKVVHKEHPNLHCRCVDLDAFTTAEQLLEELEAVTGDYQVAYRAGGRFVEEFTEIDIDRVKDRPLEIKENGVYLITGGAGGIGLEVARYLASQNRVNLALVNRSKMPERAQWAAILEAGEDERNIRKIRDIQAIESLGATVECYAVDVTNRGELAVMLDAVREKFGKLDGVVHGAGVGGAEPIVTRSQADFQAVFGPKVQGTFNLDELTQEDDLDFMVLFSSIASMFSMPGQGDYIAANSYLDSYSAYRNKQGKRTITINWSTWRETGMSVSHNFNIDTLFKAIMTEDAIRGLDAVLNKAVPRALIGEVNYDSKIIFLLKKSMFRLSSKINSELANRTGASKQKSKKSEGAGGGEVVLVGNENGEYIETEKRIAQICQGTLGFDEINIYDNFFEMGADSILLTRMHTLLDKEFPGMVAVTDIFEYTSIHRLAQYIKSQQQPSDSSQPIASQEEDLEDALRSIFDELENDNISIEEALNSLKDI